MHTDVLRSVRISVSEHEYLEMDIKEYPESRLFVSFTQLAG